MSVQVSVQQQQQQQPGFARKMMESMGWKEGMGLGKDGQGVKTALKPKKKVDSAGLGAKRGQTKWTAVSCVYDSILAKLNVAFPEPDAVTASSEESKSDGKKRKRSETKEERRQRKKAKKALKFSAAETQEDSSRGRSMYKKRLRSKQVKSYSAADKAEIFGLQARDESVVEKVSAAASPASVLFGDLASEPKQPSVAPKSKVGFTEDTQVDIYNQTMDSSIKGRVGLGLGKKLSKSQRRDAAQQDARLARTGTYLSRKFVFAGFLGDMIAESQRERDEKKAQKTKAASAAADTKTQESDASSKEAADKAAADKQARKERKRLKKLKKARKAERKARKAAAQC